MHTPSPRPHGPRRSSSRPLDVAASLVLTVGLLGSAAPAALAADAAPTAQPQAAPSQPPSPAPTSSPAVEHPALERTVTATFQLLGTTTEGGEPFFRSDFTIHLKNTGDVPLNVFLENVRQRGDAPITLAVGESKDVPGDAIVVQRELADGFWHFRTNGAAYTPQGVRIDAGIDASVPVPGAKPTPAPSQPATPSPVPSQPSTPSSPTPAPSTEPASAHPAVTVTITGKFLTEPGELVKEGTRVQFTYDVKNTGGVDLTDVLGHKKLAVGESFLLNTTEAVVSAQNLKDGFVPAESKLVRGTLPNGSRVTVSEPFVYKLPIPEKPPIPVQAPDLDVKVSGTFQVKEGEPVVAGTKVKWVAAVTNTGNVALRDVQVADSEKLAELPVGDTGTVSFETTVTERDVFNHSIWVASPATATTPDGTTFTKNTLGTLAIPAVVPVPTPTPTPTPTGTPTPAPTPTPTGTPTPTPTGTPTPTPTPAAAASTRPAAGVTVPTASSGAASTASKRSAAGQLASTGSDAAAVLPAAGVLALLGAVGLFLGRRRRNRTTTE